MKQLLKKNNNCTKNSKMMTRTLLLSEGFGFCFSLSCIMGYRLDHTGTLFASTWQVVSGLILALLLGAVFAAIYSKLSKLGFDRFFCRIETNQKESVINDSVLEGSYKTDFFGGSFRANWLIFSGIIALFWAPVFLAYYPAVFSYDAEAQLYQIISGNYSTHHPLLHTLFMGLCMKIGYAPTGINAGMALYASVQFVIMTLICGWVIAEMIRLKTGRVWVVVYTVFIALFPVHSILAISTTKDVLFSGFAILFTFFVRRYVVEGRNTKIDLVKIAVAALMMQLFRNNAGYALFAVLVLMGIVCLIKKKKNYRKLLIVFAVALVSSMVVSTGLKTVLLAESGSPREMLSIPIQQMARVKSLHNDELDSDLRENLNLLIADEWADRYDEHLADPIKERISMKNPGLFVKTWIKLGCKYPGAYIDAWLLTTEGAWYIRDTSCNRIYGEGQITGFGYLSTDIRNMPEGFEVTNDSRFPAFRLMLEKIVSDNAFEKIPVIRILFAPALYVWIMLFFIFHKINKREYAELVPVTFLFMYLLTLMLSPAILVRYMYPYMLAVMLPFIDREHADKRG